MKLTTTLGVNLWPKRQQGLFGRQPAKPVSKNNIISISTINLSSNLLLTNYFSRHAISFIEQNMLFLLLMTSCALGIRVTWQHLFPLTFLLLLMVCSFTCLHCFGVSDHASELVFTLTMPLHLQSVYLYGICYQGFSKTRCPSGLLSFALNAYHKIYNLAFIH